jgi:hypothetical protein
MMSGTGTRSGVMVRGGGVMVLGVMVSVVIVAMGRSGSRTRAPALSFSVSISSPIYLVSSGRTNSRLIKIKAIN